MEVERVLAEEAKERQIENGKNNALNLTQFQECRNQEKIPDSGDVKPEPQARDKAASIIGNTNARYVQDAKKIEREAPEVKELVMAEEARERQIRTAENREKAENLVVEFFPQQEPEEKSREKAASIIGHRVNSATC